MNRVFILGDIHGDFKPIRDFVTYMNSTYDKNKKLNPSDTLILLGDVGLNFFFNHRDKEIKKKLGKYNLTYFCIRGNHEQRPEILAEQNPEAWTVETYFGAPVWVEKEYPYIKYAADYVSIYYINGHKTLVIPGAYSVDKYIRLQNNWSWFEHEQLTPNEMFAGTRLAVSDSFDLVLSHTCPIQYEPTDLFLSCVDQSKVDKSMERWMGKLEREMDYKLWLFGHYHKYRVIVDDLSSNDVIMLFNDVVFDLDKYFELNSPYLASIHFHKEVK